MGAAHHVERGSTGPDPKRDRPLAGEDLDAVDDRRSSGVGGGEQGRLAPAVDEVDHRAPSPSAARSSGSSANGSSPCMPDRGGVDDQLVRWPRPRDLGDTVPPSSAQRFVERAAVRFQTSTSRPPGPEPRPAARAAPPAPRRGRGSARGRLGQAARKPSASVLTARISSPSKLRVLAAPISRAASESSSATARAAPLWGS